MPGHAAKPCACAVFESSGHEANMASGATGPDRWVIYVISTFRRGEEGFNDVGSIKTDIYYAPGCVWLAATSI